MKRCRQQISELIGVVSPAAKRKKMITEPFNVDNIELTPSGPSSIPIAINTNEQQGSQNIETPVDIFSLNGDCLRNIFEYCSVVDMYNMVMASDELKIAIVENCVRGRLIDFGELAECCHILNIFKLFGQQMTKIKIGEKDIQYKAKKLSKFDEILRLISTYCSVDTLKYLELEYFYGTSIKKRFLYASLPFFRSIESLTINETDHNHSEINTNYFRSHPMYNPSINDFVERIVANAVSIDSMELYRLKLTGRFFYVPQVQNLKTLTFVGCIVKVPDAFISFLRDQPKLKSFTWDDSTLHGLDTYVFHSSDLVYELVANHIPDLESLHYNPNEGFINNRNKYDTDSYFKPPNYDLIGSFEQLKILSFPQITIDCLKLLSEQNRVEKLNCFNKNINSIDLHSMINYYNNYPLFIDSMDLNFLAQYSNLKYIKLFTTRDTKSFNMEILSKLPQLSECSLVFLKIDKHVEDVIQHAVESSRYLSTLNIWSLIGGFSIAMYSKLLEFRLRDSLFENTLTIYVKKASMRKFLCLLGETYRPDIIKIRKAK